MRSGTIVSCSEISEGAADSCSVSAEAMVDSLFPVVGNRLRRFAPGACLLVWTSGSCISDGTEDVAQEEVSSLKLEGADSEMVRSASLDFGLAGEGLDLTWPFGLSSLLWTFAVESFR